MRLNNTNFVIPLSPFKSYISCSYTYLLLRDLFLNNKSVISHDNVTYISSQNTNADHSEQESIFMI